MYRKMYMKPAYLDALEKWEAIAKEEGVARAELAYRWVTYNCPLKKEHGDGIIIGCEYGRAVGTDAGGHRKGTSEPEGGGWDRQDLGGDQA